ncbi:MAG: hypothetical protein NZ601_07185 [candidate division WOR-3 bacterium]|nr:hypothetical protein [candidate division WOR-3 bacterium]MCX7757086.1 hypothetical protein [candidate division WOR-3 bacterium]MDW7988370.1 hypothetical protein [candidate division WOR-3 bacterium]
MISKRVNIEFLGTNPSKKLMLIDSIRSLLEKKCIRLYGLLGYFKRAILKQEFRFCPDVFKILLKGYSAENCNKRAASKKYSSIFVVRNPLISFSQIILPKSHYKKLEKPKRIPQALSEMVHKTRYPIDAFNPGSLPLAYKPRKKDKKDSYIYKAK